jgi:hypothetical protein
MHFSPEDMQYDTEFMARCRFVLVMRSMSAARDENTIFPAVFHPSNALDAAVALVNYEAPGAPSTTRNHPQEVACCQRMFREV